MKLADLKQLLASIGVLLGALAVIFLLAIAATGLVTVSTGARPGDAFSETAMVPESLRGRVTWGSTDPASPRRIEPETREAVEGAWVRAWGDLELLAAGVEDVAVETWFDGRALASITETTGRHSAFHTTDHELDVHVYSADGQIISISATTALVREVGGQEISFEETYDALLVLADGNWRIEQLVRTDSLTEL